MTITELATLAVLPPYTVSSPSVLAFLHDVARRQGAVSGYPVIFFQDTQASSTIYLVSGWESVPAHEVWIASEDNQSLLKKMAPLLEFKGLSHVEIDFETIPQQLQVSSSELSVNIKSEFVAEEFKHDAIGPPLWEASGRLLGGEGECQLRVYINSEGGSEEANSTKMRESESLSRIMTVQVGERQLAEMKRIIVDGD